MKKIIRLYEIPRESKIKVKEGTLTFHKTDGMYSYCTCDWIFPPTYNVVHLSVMTSLKRVGEHYEITEDPEAKQHAAKILGSKTSKKKTAAARKNGKLGDIPSTKSI